MSGMNLSLLLRHVHKLAVVPGRHGGEQVEVHLHGAARQRGNEWWALEANIAAVTLPFIARYCRLATSGHARWPGPGPVPSEPRVGDQ